MFSPALPIQPTGRLADAAAELGKSAGNSCGLRWQTFSRGELEHGLDLWSQLEDRLGEQGSSCSTAWIDCWLQHYGDRIAHHLLAASQGGIVRGMALLTTGVGQKLGPFGVQSMHLGTAGEPLGESVVVEYNRPLVEPGFETEFRRGLLEHLRCDLSWEQLRLDGVEEQDLAEWQRLLPGSEVRWRESRYFDLAGLPQGTGVLPALGSSTRSNLRRRLKAYPDLQADWVPPAEVKSAFAELVQLHQARWEAVGQPGAFAARRFAAFQHDLVTRLVRSQRGELFRVRSQGTTLGCLFLLNDRGRLLDYLSGFASFQEHPGIGLLTHYLCMEAAHAKEYAAYDFLVGDKQHKQNLSNAVSRLGWLTWTRPGWKSRCVSGLRAAKRMFGQLRRRVGGGT